MSFSNMYVNMYVILTTYDGTTTKNEERKEF